MTALRTVDGLGIRLRRGRKEWGVPIPFGPDGWMFEGRLEPGRIIVTAAAHELDEWVHASISRPQMPTYDDLCLLHAAVFPGGWSYQLFAPPDDHVNIMATALHLWGRPDGRPMLPNFGEWGSI